MEGLNSKNKNIKAGGLKYLGKYNFYLLDQLNARGQKMMWLIDLQSEKYLIESKKIICLKDFLLFKKIIYLN